ncbi:protein FAM151B [Ahaetulla prasina]|uniref:protein FAM151B n=1 Tax=Ahaetulla prasina TaxID=499056 RepID=UPI0026479381|nr:protein FAM151B [Ahaetulla prasina]
MQEDEREGRLGSGGSALGEVEGFWSQNILDYFLNTKQIKRRDGAEIIWYHRANSKQHMKEAIQILLFYSLEAVNPSMKLLGDLHFRQPVWINADILLGPKGNHPIDAKGFLDTVISSFPDVTLSLGWTTGRISSKCNTGYSLAMVQEMAEICREHIQPITFAVRADLVCRSKSELQWLLQQSDRYTLTIWTGKDDEYSVDDLLFIRHSFDQCRVFYDILEPQNSEFRKAIGI